MEEQERGTAALLEVGLDEHMEAAVRYLLDRLHDPGLAPSSVAGHVGLDLWQFCRKFRAATGVTCNEFIAERRMQEACRLLARPDLLIKEVAYRVGFEDANYFSRRFKSVVGTSPTAYRKNGPGNGLHWPHRW